MGQQRPRDASDLLPPRAQGRPQRRPPVRGRPAPDVLAPNGRTAGSASTSAATSPWPTRSAREIIAAGLENREFIERATVDFEAYKAKVESYTLEYAERETGVPAEAIRELAHAFATAPRAMICWTLGITEHHNAVDNVLALISLVLLTGHVGRYGSGVNPLRGQNNVQGGGDMGALPGPPARASSTSRTTRCGRSSTPSGASPVPPKRGWHLSGMFDAMERGDLTAVYCIGENPVQSEADQKRAIHLLEGLDFLVVQDLFLTKTARARRRRPAGHRGLGRERRARSPTPSAASSASARRSSRPTGARDDLAIIFDLANRMGAGWGEAGPGGRLERGPPALAGPRRDELRPARELEGGLQWPCYDETHPGELFLHSRLWEDPVPGNRVPFVPVDHDPPVDKLDADFPIRLTTGRRLDSYNTGRPDRRLHLAAAARREPRHQPGGRGDLRPGRRRARPGRLAPRPGRGPDPDRPVAAARPDVHDPALPGRGRDQPADHRRHRPEVRHGRVQGDGHPDREARGAGDGLTAVPDVRRPGREPGPSSAVDSSVS